MYVGFEVVTTLMISLSGTWQKYQPSCKIELLISWGFLVDREEQMSWNLGFTHFKCCSQSSLYHTDFRYLLSRLTTLRSNSSKNLTPLKKLWR